MFGESFHIHPQSFTLAYFQLVLLPLAEQVLDGLVVDFQHADLHLEGASAVLVGPDLLENLVADDGDDALVGSVADHGVTLAGSGLSIGEEAAVVALPALPTKYQAFVRMLEPISS